MNPAPSQQLPAVAPSPATPPPEPARAAWLLDVTEALCRDDTTTGAEDRGLTTLRALLESLGAEVELQRVADGRHNVLATWGAPRLLFSTHLDTVPPYLPPERHGDRLEGRGACDAKGQIAVQLAAIRRLLDRHGAGFAWLGVVGEETDSLGAQHAAELAPRFRDCVAAINGEPTKNLLATGQRGALQLQLTTHGVAAHSGMPERGRSAIWPLIDWLERIRGIEQRGDPDLGPEIWNLGTIEGGRAPNVIPDHAAAKLFVRSVRGSRFEDEVRAMGPEIGEVTRLAETAPEVFDRLPGFEHACVPFGSDAPRLRDLVGGRRVVLCGPGSIEVAHTDAEHITGAELVRGEDLLVEVADALLGGVTR